MATSEIWIRERVPQRQIADWINKNRLQAQFSGFLPLKIIFIMSFIILMQSRFLYRRQWVGIGTGDFYSYNEIILIGNILMVSMDCNVKH